MSTSISIITPVYNMLSFLKPCVYSVYDQHVNKEHIVIDGGSTDGTAEWLGNREGIRWISESDRGMYDALNKGLALSKGDIIGHLNADEQYLPGVLEYVIDYFEKNPDVDYIVGDFLMVNEKGEFISCRKAFPPFWPFFFSNYLYTFTCTLFYRRRVIEVLKYDASLRSIADVDFLYQVQRKNFKGVHLKKFFSVFTFTGNNLSQDPISKKEIEQYVNTNLPAWFRFANPLLKLGFYFSRLVYGTLWHRGLLSYQIFGYGGFEERKGFDVYNPSCRWVET